MGEFDSNAKGWDAESPWWSPLLAKSAWAIDFSQKRSVYELVAAMKAIFSTFRLWFLSLQAQQLAKTALALTEHNGSICIIIILSSALALAQPHAFSLAFVACVAIVFYCICHPLA